MSYITVSFDKPNAVTRAAIREARIPKRERGIKFVMTPFGYKALYGIFNGPYLSGEGRTLKSALYSVLKKIPKDDVIAIRDDWIQRNLGVEVKVPTGGIKAADLLSIVERGKGSMKTESPGMMTKDRLSVLYKKFLDKILATLEAKNHDYTGSDDPFANFRASSVYGIDPRKGILLRAQDKFMRINTHIEKGALMVEGEGVEDAIADVIGYMLLMYGMEVEAGDGADKSQSEV